MLRCQLAVCADRQADPCLLLNAPVDPVPTLDELDSYQLLRFCVAGQLHKAKAAMTEVCNLDIAGGLPEGVRVAGLHASCTHAAWPACLHKQGTNTRNFTVSDSLCVQHRVTLQLLLHCAGRERVRRMRHQVHHQTGPDAAEQGPRMKGGVCSGGSCTHTVQAM